MNTTELTITLKKEFDFIRSEKHNQNEWHLENSNLVFIFSSSNGEHFYCLKEGDKVHVRETASIFKETFKKDESVICDKIYLLIRKTLRHKHLNSFLK